MPHFSALSGPLNYTCLHYIMSFTEDLRRILLMHRRLCQCPRSDQRLNASLLYVSSQETDPIRIITLNKPKP